MRRFQVCSHGMDESAARSDVASIHRYVTPQPAADPVLATHRWPEHKEFQFSGASPRLRGRPAAEDLWVRRSKIRSHGIYESAARSDRHINTPLRNAAAPAADPVLTTHRFVDRTEECECKCCAPSEQDSRDPQSSSPRRGKGEGYDLLVVACIDMQVGIRRVRPVDGPKSRAVSGD